MQNFVRTVIVAVCFGAIPVTLAAQVKRKPVVKKPVAAKPSATPVPTPEPTPTPTPEPVKKNSGKANARPEKAAAPVAKGFVPTYFYTFDRPGFTYSQIRIEHDASGKGQISMKRDDGDEIWTDPVQLSTTTMENLNKAFTELNFIDSTADYQYSGGDYPHLGNVTITLRSGGRERTAKYNWTENKQAKVLMDEYRRISNEYTWKFEMVTARENQPLLTPGLMERLDSYLNRGELTDPSHLLPLLAELSTDERLPLMARNRASRMIERINKSKKK